MRQCDRCVNAVSVGTQQLVHRIFRFRVARIGARDANRIEWNRANGGGDGGVEAPDEATTGRPARLAVVIALID